MKHTLLFSLAVAAGLMMSAQYAGAQGMAVNTTGAAAAASSMLDITSTTKGILIPRMTAAQMSPGITSPATGLMVYNTDANAFYYYNGTSWNAVGSGTVTQMTSGNMSPIFTTSVATNTTTPALSFTLSSAAAHKFLGNSTGSSAAPTYTAVDLGADVTGNLPVGNLNGGSGASANTFWQGNGNWSSVDLSTADVTGNLGVSHLNSGTGASATTFWSGNGANGAWAVPFTLTTTGTGAATFTSGTLNIPNGGGGYSVTGFSAQPPGTAGTYFSGFANSTTVTSAALTFPSPIAKTCTLDVFTATPVCYATHLSGAANVITGLVLKNGSSTGVTISFTAPTTSTVNQVFSNVTDNTHTATFNAGDVMTIQWDQTNAVNGALDKFYLTMHFSE